MGTGHTGIITSVTRDKNGNVIAYSFIHSGSSNGPTENSVNIGKKSYYSDKVSGFYKWDSPDEPILNLKKEDNYSIQEKIKLSNPYTNQSFITSEHREQFLKAQDPQLSDYFRESKIPIIKDLGNILHYFGF